MKLSDYVAEFLVKQDVKHVFGITGGAIVHLFDSIANNKGLTYVCPQHEQTAAMAADAYSRVTGNLGVAVATSGPGATNLITGVACAHFDSIPTLFITGQVATFRLKRDSNVRQIGFQEIETVNMFKPITKYAVLVDEPNRIRFELEKAVSIAKSGRGGSCLIDIPDDIQRAQIDPEKLESFIPHKEKKDFKRLREQIEVCLTLISRAERPVVILGSGVKLGRAQEKARQFIEKLKFPVALTWATLDMFTHDYYLNAGGFGITSPRYGNFTIQNSDLIIALGTRLDTHATGSPLAAFAREAKKIILDIDESELLKFGKYGMKDALLINEDINDFLDIMNKDRGKIKTGDISRWIGRIKDWKRRYPICPRAYYDKEDSIDSYCFMDALSQETSKGDYIITDAGGTLTQTMQGYRMRREQTLFTAFNYSPMGYSLPASIGASFATNKNRVICIIGDGGIQMNIQELATIEKHHLPIKIFVINNQGYGMIKQTQDDWLDSRYEASSMEKGIAVPDFVKIAKAYGIDAEKISNHSEMNRVTRRVLNREGPLLCDVHVSENQRVVPMLKFGRPIEDASPLLERKEFLENMIIKPWT
ncbi:MAG: hypothetical protein A2987_03990 [Omnitrophica bacterium RIFCSPLOWO2_01_FULL_45_10]|nr:MAG: hypothetical protein A2987_03990 [Omnitrophica bacterium RIFCSPLOWO2_01_FULL_45_10]